MDLAESTLSPARILIIEDDPSYSAMVKRALVRQGYQADIAATGQLGLDRLADEKFDLVVTDLRLRDIDGMEVVQRLSEDDPPTPVVLMTGFGTSDVAIKALQLGAVDFLQKPFQISDLLKTVEAALTNRPTPEESVPLDQQGGHEFEIIGKSRAMQGVFKQISKLAPSKLTVLIHGETGTGKELAARALHQHSPRSNHPFVAVNCMAIPEALLESELFGHERGAFTGAVAQRIGWFERADHGSLFLDEIGDISLETQAKLLRAIQERSIQRVGGRSNIVVDVRIIAATNRDLIKAIHEKLFREDLYYRLSGAIINLPPLRERKEDILSLVGRFVRRHRTEGDVEKIRISVEALRLLEQHDWPGNIRELENVIYRASLATKKKLISGDAIREALDQPSARRTAESGGFEQKIAEFLDAAEQSGQGDVCAKVFETVERELYRQAYERAKGKQSKMIDWLGVSRPTVLQKLRQFGLLS
jgi:DNA-binding NtrC family response regulator